MTEDQESYKALFGEEDEEAFLQLIDDLGGVSYTDGFRENVRALNHPAVRDAMNDLDADSPHEAVVLLAKRHMNQMNDVIASSEEKGIVKADLNGDTLELKSENLNDLRFGHGISIPIHERDDWNSIVKTDRRARLRVTEAHVNYESSGTIDAKRVERLIEKAWHPTDLDGYLRMFADCADVYPHPGADDRVTNDVDEYRIRAAGEDPKYTELKHFDKKKREFFDRPLKEFLTPVWEIIGKNRVWYTDRDVYLSDLWRIIRITFQVRSQMNPNSQSIGVLDEQYQAPAIDVLIERLIGVLEHESSLSIQKIRRLQIAAKQLQRDAKDDFGELWPIIERQIHSALIEEIIDTPLPIDEARAILNVDSDASLDEITESYRDQMKRVHPDHGGDGDRRQFKQLKDAKKTLHIIHGQDIERKTLTDSNAATQRIDSAETIEEKALAKLESGQSLSDLSQDERDAIMMSDSLEKRNSGEGTQSTVEWGSADRIRGLPDED